ncbi:hypothetical protein FRC11_004558, partial [Ceratobasidium sp. 423]
MKRPNILGSSLGAVVTSSGPASQLLVPCSNASLNLSPARGGQPPLVLDFQTDEGREKIRKWYNDQSTTRFTSIEYHKETEGRFGHEFIVAYLDDDSTVCRFDRRARRDMRGHALKDEGTASEDSVQVVALADIGGQNAYWVRSEALLTIDLSQGQDLKFILAVCHAIQSHPRAKSYSLLYYNCYFFSWTLVTAVARQEARWELAVTPNTKKLWEGVASILYPKNTKELQKEPQIVTGTSGPFGIRSFIHQVLGRFSVNMKKSQVRSSPVPPQDPDSDSNSDVAKLHTREIFAFAQQELEDRVPGVLSTPLKMLLLKSRLPHMLSRGIYLACLDASQAIVKRYVANETLDKMPPELWWPPHTPRITWATLEACVSHANQRMISALCCQASDSTTSMGGGTVNNQRQAQLNHSSRVECGGFGPISLSGVLASIDDSDKINILDQLDLSLGEEEWNNTYVDAWAEATIQYGMINSVEQPDLLSNPHAYNPGTLPAPVPENASEYSSIGKRAWREEWENLVNLWGSRTMGTYTEAVTDCFLQYLVDPEWTITQPVTIPSAEDK